MITETLNKISTDLQQVVKKQDKIDSTMAQVEIKLNALDEKVDYKIEGVHKEIQSVRNEIKLVNERATDIGAVRNWFVGLLTAIVTTGIVVVVKLVFFN